MNDERMRRVRFAAAAIALGAAFGPPLPAVELATPSKPTILRSFEAGGAAPFGRIEVVLDGAPAWEEGADAPGRFAIDLVNTRPAPGVVTRLFASGLVSGVRVASVGVPSRPVTRLLIETRGAAAHRVRASADRLVIDVAPKGTPFPAAPAAPPAPAPRSAPRSAPIPAPVAAPVVAAPPAVVPPAPIPIVDAGLAPRPADRQLSAIAVTPPPVPAARVVAVPTPPEPRDVRPLESPAPAAAPALPTLAPPRAAPPAARVVAVPTPPEPAEVRPLESAPPAAGRVALPTLAAPATAPPAPRVVAVPTPPEPESVAALAPTSPVASGALAPLPAPAAVRPAARIAAVPTPLDAEAVVALEPARGASGELAPLPDAPPSAPPLEVAAVPTPVEPAAPALVAEDLSAPRFTTVPAPARAPQPAAPEPQETATSLFAPRAASEAPPEPLPQVEPLPDAAPVPRPRDPQPLTWLPFVDADLEPVRDAPQVEPAAPPETLSAPGEGSAPHPDAAVAPPVHIEEEDLGEPLAPSPPASGSKPPSLPAPLVTGTADHPWTAPAPAGAAGTTILGIEHTGERTVTVAGDGEFAYATFRLAEPHRFVIDLAGVVSRAPRTILAIDEGIVQRVRVSQFRGAPSPVARVIFDLTAPAIPRIERSAAGLVIRFE